MISMEKLMVRSQSVSKQLARSLQANLPSCGAVRGFAKRREKVSTSFPPRQVIDISKGEEPKQFEYQNPVNDPDSPVLLQNEIINLRVARLNRPKQLNALNLEMIRLLTPKFQSWDRNDTVMAIVMHGEGGKAFCAGGDILFLHKHGQSESLRPLAMEFFREEYQLNYLISQLKTPLVSFLNGTTMGGGVGLSVHGDYVVATEETLFAMPETGIGLFPDVGGSYALPRIQNIGQGPGTFLALTGHRLKGVELVPWGLATHFIPTYKLGEMIQSISCVDLERSQPKRVRDEVIGNCLSIVQGEELNPYYNPGPGEDHIMHDHLAFMEKLERIFGRKDVGDSVEDIMERLKEDGSEWAMKQLKTLNRMSPTSLKVTHRQMREGAGKSLKECLQMEYRIVSRVMEGKDFFEGVRALLIDKDKKPSWSPSSLAEVADRDIDEYFKRLPEKEELKMLEPQTYNWKRFDKKDHPYDGKLLAREAEHDLKALGKA